MKRKLLTLLAVVALIFTMGCAALQVQWDALSPDQKTRLTVDMLQEQLEDVFDSSKAYVGLHPEYAEKWKTQIVPAFDLANKALRDVIELAQKEDITPSDVRAKVNPFINDLMLYLSQIGWVE